MNSLMLRLFAKILSLIEEDFKVTHSVMENKKVKIEFEYKH